MVKIDMKMPESCMGCKLTYTADGFWICAPIGINLDHVKRGERHPDCPLHPLDDEICVGDEVYDERTLVKSVVWRINERSIFHVDVKGYSWVDDKKFLVKTGRHFDEVEALLKKMRGKEE